MQTTESKIITYLGFSVKGGKIVFGLDNAERLKRGKLLLYDQSLSERSCKRACELAERLHCPVLIYRGEIAELLHKPGCKLAVLTDQHLADAVLKTAAGTENFCLGQGNGGNS